MFRGPVVILLIITILTQSLSKGIIVLSYFTNKQAYERYCINKSRPQLHCDGKCQMAKKIKAEEERDQKDPLKSSSFHEVAMTDKHHFVSIPAEFRSIQNNIYLFPYSIGKARTMSRSCFHPPNIAV